MNGWRAVPRAGLRARGFTLVEVAMVIAILGLILGMSGLAFLSLRPPRVADDARDLRLARERAIRRGRPTVAEGGHESRIAHVLFLPDGRALGSGVDPLTGAPLDSPH